MLESPAAGSQNAAVIDAIAKQGSERSLTQSRRGTPQFFLNTLWRQRKRGDFLRQPCGVLAQNRLPYRRHFHVKFHHHYAINPLLEGRRQADDAAPCKWLDEFTGFVSLTPKPLSHARHKPRFASWIAERTAL